MYDGVLVTGMHRSGTSLTTRLLTFMGLNLSRPSDYVRAFSGNPRGVWESSSMVRFNDHLLAAIGAAWWCPPDPSWRWWDDEKALSLEEAGRATFNSTYQVRPWVWKDPRTAITLPFWISSLRQQPPMVLVVRHPLAVANSLRVRNQISVHFGLALWERYCRELLSHAVGSNVLIARYDDIVRDPLAWCEEALGFLRSVGMDAAHPADGHAVNAFVQRPVSPRDPGLLARQRAQLSRSQQRLWSYLAELPSRLGALTTSNLPPETPSTERLFTEAATDHKLARRTSVRKTRRSKGLPSRIPIVEAKGDVQTDDGLPTMGIVIISRNEGDMLWKTVARLMAATTSTAQIVVVDDDSSDDSAATLIERCGPVTVHRNNSRLGVSGSRAAGAALVMAPVVVFADAHVDPVYGWNETMLEALQRPETGAVVPAISLLRDRRRNFYGLTFRDASLNVRWIEDAPRASSAPVPLAAGCFLAMRREVLEAAHGWDTGMTAYGTEDVELSIRLWRMGYECLVLPGVQVGHRFVGGARRDVNPAELFQNRLRMASIHLSTRVLTAFVTRIRSEPWFADVAARVATGDVGKRRAEINPLCWYDGQWFLDRFGIVLSEV